MSNMELGITFIKLGVAIIVIAAIIAYTVHVWSDCLDENSVLTCMRMLSK